MKFGLFILPSWPEAEPAHQSRILQEAVDRTYDNNDYAELIRYETHPLGRLTPKEREWIKSVVKKSRIPKNGR